MIAPTIRSTTTKPVSFFKTKNLLRYRRLFFDRAMEISNHMDIFQWKSALFTFHLKQKQSKNLVWTCRSGEFVGIKLYCFFFIMLIKLQSIRHCRTNSYLSFFIPPRKNNKPCGCVGFIHSLPQTMCGISKMSQPGNPKTHVRLFNFVLFYPSQTSAGTAAMTTNQMDRRRQKDMQSWISSSSKCRRTVKVTVMHRLLRAEPTWV